MGNVSGLLKMLSADEMEELHQSALKILSNIGMWIEAEDARNYLKDVGCDVNNGTKIVLYPKKVVENALKNMRNNFENSSKGDIWARVRYSRTFFTSQPHRLHTDFTANAGGFPPFILDLDKKRRMANLSDVIDSIKLVDGLDNIDMAGLPCSAQDIPHEERPIKMTAELLKRTKKIGGIEAFNKRDVRAIAQMCDVITGSREASILNPIVMGYAETRSPLCFDESMSDMFVEYAKLGFPQSVDCMPCAGTTAPASIAGTIALGLAESLSSVVLGFAVNPDARMGIIINPSVADMKTLVFPYASPDRMTLTAGMVQMLHEYYGCPTGVHSGKTDACQPNAQAGFEKALSTITPILFGAIGIGTLGNIEAGGLTYSPVQLVIDNEIVGYIKRIFKGFEVNEESIAYNVIKEVGHGGNFITHMHTANNFRKEFDLPSDIVERLAWSSWESQEIKGIEEKAAEKAKKLMVDDKPGPLTEDQEKEIDDIVKSYLDSCK